MTQLKYFKIIYLFLVAIYFLFNYFSLSIPFSNNLSIAKDSEIKGISMPSYELFVINNAELVENGVRKITDIKYVNDSEASEKLDIYLPENMYKAQKYPLIIYLHGGAWLEGSKDYFKDYELVKNDFIVASVNYRLSSQDLFPAQIHDVKAALRWLKKNATLYNIDSSNIGAYGESAGGHLAALLGTTSNDEKMNGDIGLNLNQYNDIQAVVSEFGLPNFQSIAKQCEANSNCKTLYKAENSILSNLLGCKYNECKEDLKFASPYNYVTSDDAAFLQLHGKKDSIVPFEQVLEFHDKLLEQNLYSETIISNNGVHIDGDDREKYLNDISNFFDWRLKKEKFYFCSYDSNLEEIYPDITRNSDYFEAVNNIACKHGFYGVLNEKLETEKPFTRAEIARILSIVFNISPKNSCDEFDDVDKYNRNYVFIQGLKCNNITKGYENNQFKPDKNASALEIISMIAKLKKLDIDFVIEKSKTNKVLDKLDNNNELNRGEIANLINVFMD